MHAILKQLLAVLTAISAFLGGIPQEVFQEEVSFDNVTLGNTTPLVLESFSTSVAGQEARGWNVTSKLNPDGHKTSKFGVGWQNYLDIDNQWKTLEGKEKFIWNATSKKFEADMGMFEITLPEISTGIATFTEKNRWDIGGKQKILSPTISENIQAEGISLVTGILDNGGRCVKYPLAYSTINADLKYCLRLGGIPTLDKLVVIKSPLSADTDISWLFTTSEKVKLYQEDIPKGVVRTKKEVPFSTNKGFIVKTQRLDSVRSIGTDPPTIWDSAATRISEEVNFTITPLTDTSFRFTKHIKGSFFSKPLVYPVTTDLKRYPDSGTASTTVDGWVRRTGTAAAFGTLRSGAGTAADTITVSSACWSLQTTTVTDEYDQLWRSIYNFDTSAIPDGDTVSSSTIAFVVAAGSIRDNLNLSISVAQSGSAVNNDLAASDFNIASWTMTEQVTASIDVTSLVTSQYNTFTLNSTGNGNISKTGVTKFGVSSVSDITNVAPTWSSAVTGDGSCISADEVGLTNDPRLIIDHAAPVAVPRNREHEELLNLLFNVFSVKIAWAI